MKQEYIKMRNTKQYNLNWFYRYYLESSKDNIDINTFAMILNQVSLDNILEHIDKQFELTTLTDNNGKFIKIL
jgi:hypothetical protein